MEDYLKYLDIDFGSVEDEQFHIDGYVYYAGDPEGKEYRSVQFSYCYIPLDKRKDEEYVAGEEEVCKQYMEDLSEEEAIEVIKWYLENCEML